MATITLRVEDEIREELEGLARSRRSTVSDVLRYAIGLVLDRDVEPSSVQTPPALGAIERRSLMLQHEILARLSADDPDESAYHRRMLAILGHGFTYEYDQMFTGVYPEISRRDSRFVIDLLEMFRVLKVSLERLSEAEVAELGERAVARLSYRGFDFNDSAEGRLADYAKHLIDTGRWRELAEHFDAKHEQGNSHAPMIETYRRMLAAFQPIWAAKIDKYSLGADDGFLLSTAQLAEVLRAWEYPR